MRTVDKCRYVYELTINTDIVYKHRHCLMLKSNTLNITRKILRIVNGLIENDSKMIDKACFIYTDLFNHLISLD